MSLISSSIVGGVNENNSIVKKCLCRRSDSGKGDHINESLILYLDLLLGFEYYTHHIMDLYFQFGISDATECDQCPEPGETTARMASISMWDCSMSAFILFVKHETRNLITLIAVFESFLLDLSFNINSKLLHHSTTRLNRFPVCNFSPLKIDGQNLSFRIEKKSCFMNHPFHSTDSSIQFLLIVTSKFLANYSSLLLTIEAPFL